MTCTKVPAQLDADSTVDSSTFIDYGRGRQARGTPLRSSRPPMSSALPRSSSVRGTIRRAEIILGSVAMGVLHEPPAGDGGTEPITAGGS